MEVHRHLEVLKATDCHTLVAREWSCKLGGHAAHVLASQPIKHDSALLGLCRLFT